MQQKWIEIVADEILQGLKKLLSNCQRVFYGATQESLLYLVNTENHRNKINSNLFVKTNAISFVRIVRVREPFTI